MNTLPAVISISDIEDVQGEPRVQDTVIAKALGYKKARDIRPLIVSNIEALSQLGNIAPSERRVAKTTATVYHLNEEQALYITAKSNTPKAADITVAMVKVFAAWRNGHLEPQRPNLEGALLSALAGEVVRMVLPALQEALDQKLAPVTQAITYKSGEQEGDTKEVATGKQVGRVINMVGELDKKVSALVPATTKQEGESVWATLPPSEQSFIDGSFLKLAKENPEEATRKAMRLLVHNRQMQAEKHARERQDLNAMVA